MYNLLLAVIFISFSSNIYSATDSTKNIPREVKWYRYSGEAKLCYLQAYELAKIKLDKQLKKKWDKTKAIVFDIDETVLDNSKYQLRLAINGEDYNSESWHKWVEEADADTISGALEFIKYAKSKGIQIFYISNRSVNELKSTLINLKKFNFPDVNETHVLLKEESSDKSSRRDIVSKTHSILLFLGDNLRDFTDNFAHRDENERLLIDKYYKELDERFIVFPNPMYGEWERYKVSIEKSK